MQELSESDAKEQANVALDVVAWMCDGQNKDMQNTFRKQNKAFPVTLIDTLNFISNYDCRISILSVLQLCCFKH